jgi:bacterioferritin-associated ferredoxin
MIVCVCHRISERDIQRAAGEGVTSFEQLQHLTRVASSCGCCHDCAREVLEAALRSGALCGGRQPDGGRTVPTSRCAASG